VRDRPIDVMQRLLTAYQLGVIVCDRRAEPVLHQIAVMFHEPKFVVDDIEVWHEKLRASIEKHTAQMRYGSLNWG
jgi:hypothetical protein